MWFEPCWPSLAGVRALSTDRHGGFSKAPFQSLNLGTHAGDRLEDVIANREQLEVDARLPNQPVWLEQVHGTDVKRLQARDATTAFTPLADASYTRSRNQICVVLTADCLPVLLRSIHGDEVAAVHAGWRGLAAGVIESAVQQFDCEPNRIEAWFGPAIGPSAFEVGQDVYDAFVSQDNQAAKAFLSRGSKYLADIYLLARQRLNHLGISEVYGGEFCTFSQPDRFYSYRRASTTGRQASLIWLD